MIVVTIIIVIITIVTILLKIEIKGREGKKRKKGKCKNSEHCHALPSHEQIMYVHARTGYQALRCSHAGKCAVQLSDNVLVRLIFHFYYFLLSFIYYFSFYHFCFYLVSQLFVFLLIMHFMSFIREMININVGRKSDGMGESDRKLFLFSDYINKK